MIVKHNLSYLRNKHLPQNYEFSTSTSVSASVSIAIEAIEKLGAGQKIYTSKKFCECPNSEKGVIIIDVSAHEPTCVFRKRVGSKEYVADTSITPEDFKDGYGLGVAL